jgi:predicted SAM-dependent methyltransferase
MKLDIGCGEAKRDGYVGLDIVGVEGVDHVVDVANFPLPYEDNSVEHVYLGNFLQCLADADVINVMTEVHRVLAKGAEVEIIVPNLPKLLELFLDAKFEEKWSVWVMALFGTQERLGQVVKTGFDADKLFVCFEHIGFTDARVEEVWASNQPCLRATARKKNVSLLV